MKKILYFLMGIFLLIPSGVFAENSSDMVTFSQCVDGNSARFLLGIDEVRVKFVGIDVFPTIKSSSEDEIDGQSVSDYVCSILMNAKEIKIEYEPKITEKDKYGRLSAWVFVDGVLLQEHLVKQGYAKVAFLEDDYLYARELQESLSYAQENQLGGWKEEPQDIEEKPLTEEAPPKRSFFSSIFAFINEIFEKLLNFLDDLISNML